MSTEQVSNGVAPEVVGSAFVQQYYKILSSSPSEAHKFYQDKSGISRPDAKGALSFATTLTGINKLILSLDYANCIVQIVSADAQQSFGNGVMVLVTGFMTGKDNLRRKFTQAFFLVQEEERYYVLNDIFRHVDDGELVNIKIADAEDDETTTPVTPDTEPTSVSNGSAPVEPLTPVVEEDSHPVKEASHPVKEASHPVDNGKVPTTEKHVNVDQSVAPTQDSSHPPTSKPAAEVPVSKVQEDAPKKSFASVVNALNLKKQPFQQKALPAKPVQKQATVAPAAAAAASPRPAPSVPVSQSANNGAEKSNKITVRGHAIFVANLPMEATPAQLVDVFGEFGPIKPNGVQVRSYKLHKNCFGFVEFETAEAVQKACEVHKFYIGGRPAFVEAKNADDERGDKYPSRKGGYRNDEFRGRGNNGGGRGYGRNDGENRGTQAGYGRNDGENRGTQARNPTARNGEAGQKVYQNGKGRAANQAQGEKN